MTPLKKAAVLALALAGLLALLFSKDLPQRNPETIFLTRDSLQEYTEFQKNIVEKQSLVIKKTTQDKEEFYSQLKSVEELCADECQVLQNPVRVKKGIAQNSAEDDLIRFETDQFVAAIVMSDTDLVQKKILQKLETSPYWNDSATSFAGIPYTNYLLDKYSLAIQEELFPMMFGLGLVIAVLFIGQIKNALIVYLPCLFSAGFSLATLKVLYGQMNMVTSIIPLVVFTVCLSLSFHLYFSLVELKTLKEFFRFKWAPLFLMTFTTYIGFLSLGWAEILVIRQFGLVAAQLVLFCTLYLLLWYYLFEKPISTQVQKERKELLFFKGLFEKSFTRSAILLLAILGIASVALVPGRLNVVTDATLYFPKDQKIREKIVENTKTVSGMPVMEIVVDLGRDFSADDIHRMSRLEEGLNRLKMTQNYRILGNNSLIKKVNAEYSGNNVVPDDINAWLLLRSQLPLSLQESYPVENKYRMTVLGEPLNVREYLKDLQAVKSYLQEQKVTYQINGIHHNLMVSQSAMISVLTESFLSSAVVIFIFSAFFLKSLKDNLIFIFVSLLPVALTFGVIYFLGFTINIATVMTFSISLGLVGDSSFHIIYAKKIRFKNFREYSRGVLSPVVGSGLLLCTCFGMFAFNSFIPIRQFGGILAIILLLGTLVDLFVLPTLLYNSSRHKECYENPKT